ncbi:hypothetical protein MANI_026098 [Metarhizium anisopliae]|nr:hypothetical protein MANI_026098 [Metarhizium anisopliae]
MSTIFVNPEDQALVKARHEAFIAAFNDGADVDRVMSFFSPELSYSDYTIAALDMNYNSTRSYIEKMFTEVDNIHLIQVRVSGDRNFTAGEWILKFKFKNTEEGISADGAAKGFKVGDSVEMRGVSLSWYDAAGLIVRNCDYGVTWAGGKV